MAAPLTGAEGIIAQTASGSVITSVESNSKAVGMLGGAFPPKVQTSIATVGNGTLTAAGLLGGNIQRSGSVAAFTDTLDTAANIIAALPVETPVNFEWKCFIRNTTAFAETIQTATGVTLQGETVIPPNSTGVFSIQLASTVAITMTGLVIVPTDLGTIMANSANSTVGNGTLTAAQIVGGMITRSGSTAAYTDTTDSAANIIAALPNAQVGQSFELSIQNTTAFAQTLAAGAGVTLSGLSSPIPANSTARCLASYTASNAVTILLESIAYNAANGMDPNTTQTQFGSSTTGFLEEGTLGRSVSGAGINPGGTGGDYVLAAFTIPASALDGVGNRGVSIVAKGALGANANSKRIKIIVNPASATVGSLVGGGGTTVEDTGAQTINAGGWWISADVFKYGAAGSNTQIATSNGKVMGSSNSAHLGVQAPSTLTATESGNILVAITGNAATLAADIALNTAYATALN